MIGRLVRLALAVGFLAALLVACGSAAFPPGSLVVGGERSVMVVRPPDHDSAVATPLLVVLHGYATDAERMERLFPLAAGAAVKGAMVVYPEGTYNGLGHRYWNASEACCDLFDSGVDDVAYLMGLIGEIETSVAVDRVVLFGHSNGAFMAYRLACEHGERFAAVVGVAGTLDDPPPACDAPSPPRMLHVHGTEDGVIRYDGGALPGGVLQPPQPPYVGAEATYETIAARSGCTTSLVQGTPFDLDEGVTGPETTPFAATCPEGRSVALWAIEGGEHEPDVYPNFAARVLGFALPDPAP
ncbi:MAG: PHB depolymerase family esterase [Trueperaceae bacterium]|nr:PHB depolymerase family esterase [Trueperaceae bacterium]